MAGMRRGLVHATAWSLATGAAVTLSWWGVRAVMTGTVYDRPAAVPLAAVPESPAPQAASTHRPKPVPSPSPSRSARPPSSPAAPPPAAEPSARGTGSAPPAAPAAPSPSPSVQGTVRSYAVAGGWVAFSLGDRSAELVSATPASGWQMQVWKQDTWIRVTFTGDGREVSVFCVWHDTAPRVEIDERPA
ncbi:hypothetical protein BJP39_21565 [Streptomyces sp. CC77]|nr:hypothetical protein [Streptomyces sp. CC77]OII68398.1 hypothetical protein BJP39_21565 [Streptomyces sp. CC77]